MIQIHSKIINLTNTHTHTVHSLPSSILIIQGPLICNSSSFILTVDLFLLQPFSFVWFISSCLTRQLTVTVDSGVSSISGSTGGGGGRGGGNTSSCHSRDESTQMLMGVVIAGHPQEGTLVLMTPLVRSGLKLAATAQMPKNILR